MKYGDLLNWSLVPLPKCSWFFRSLCKTAESIKSQLRINSVCPPNTSFLCDPWCSEIPLAFKPTFLNMNFNLDQIKMKDLISNGSWDNSLLEKIFGAGFNSHSMKLGMINPTSSNTWVWFPTSNNNKLSMSIY